MKRNRGISAGTVLMLALTVVTLGGFFAGLVAVVAEHHLIGIAADMILVCWLKSSEIKAFQEVEVLTKQAESQKELLSAILDNMPALSFSKDAKTGAYLYCNQRFASYSNKPLPSETIGLTDFDIFDAKTANRLVENDKKTLSMDTPLVSYTDVLNAQGNPRQFQTTEVKYLDSDGDWILLGMSMDITEMEKFKKESARVEEERKAYLRLSALSGNLIELYYIDPETEAYTEFTSPQGYEHLGRARQGTDFFRIIYEKSFDTIHPDDLEMVHSQVTKENILSTINRDGLFLLDYRLMIGGKTAYVRLKAVTMNEEGKSILIIGLLDEDAQIRQEREYAHNLSVARKMATIDSLTGVKNKHAFSQWEEKINHEIQKGSQAPFAAVFCDVNDLKAINDLYGHKEGDACIQKACQKICWIFNHSPVFRMGGDEFLVLLSGEDYVKRNQLMQQVTSLPEDPSKIKIGEIIAAGMAEYNRERHHSLAPMIEEADEAMYAHKRLLKKKVSFASTSLS